MASRPGQGITVTDVLLLEACDSGTMCFLEFETNNGHLILEQLTASAFADLRPTTRPNPADPLPMPSRPNAATITEPVQTRGQRAVSASPIEILASDEILTVNIGTGTPVCTLPPVASRQGAPLTFKDVGGHFFTNNLTLTGQGGELIDGLPTYVAANNWAAVTVNPFNDGVNNGWFVT